MGEQSLKQKTKIGVIWSTISSFSSGCIGFIINIVLARLLSPEAYGIVAMPYIFLRLAQAFIDSGFSNALIRKKQVEESDLSTAFYFNAIVAIVCYAFLFFLSPFIAAFYNTPILTDVLKVSALAILINPLYSVHQVLMTRNIDFKKQTQISVLSQIISGAIGILMAYADYGVWALVIYQVSNAAIRLVMFWALIGWYPKAGWSSQSFKYLWNFGSRMLASAILAIFSENLGSLIIGKVFTPKDLGNYTKSRQFGELPSSVLTGVLQRVTFPVLSKIQDEEDRLSKNYRKIIRLSAFVIFPIMIGFAAISHSFVSIFLGDQWLDCVLILQFVCFAMMWYPVHAINLNLLEVKGRSDLFFRIELFKQLLSMSITLSVVWMGVYWLAAAGIVSSLVCLVINTYYTGKFINVGFLKQMKDLLPTTIISLIMFALILTFNMFVNNTYLEMVGGVIIGVVSYILLSCKFNKSDVIECCSLLPVSLQQKIVKYYKLSN